MDSWGGAVKVFVVAQREEKGLFRAGETAELMSGPDTPAAPSPAGKGNTRSGGRGQRSRAGRQCKCDDVTVHEAQKADALSRDDCCARVVV